jgi:hypothetical protein
MNILLIEELLKCSDFELQATQHRLSFPILLRLYTKMKSGIRFEDIKVHGNLIIDGHHRYIASIVANYKLGVVPYPSTSATRSTFWREVSLDMNDWDTTAEILKHNKYDALYNSIDLSEISKILE